MTRRFLVLAYLLLPGITFAQPARELRWCADTTGGAPFVFTDLKHPDHIIGFEVDLMEALSKELGVTPRIVLGPWEDLVPMLLRGDCDVAVNGIEITSERKSTIDFGMPYYFFTEQITVRKGDQRFSTLKDLSGHRVGTLSASLAEDMLRQDPSITTVRYPSPVESYRDLELGRLDAALFDGPIASWYAGPNPKLYNVPTRIGESAYGAAFRKDSTELRQAMNLALMKVIRSGQVELIYRAWNLWTPEQKKLASLLPEEPSGREIPRTWWQFYPLLLKGAGLTILISILAMALAVVGGFSLSYARLYGGPVSRACSNAYVEVIRGTPLLIQLYLIYYGLPNIGIELDAFTAAVLGMGMNYSAYESEIYRAGLLSIPRGQTDAARSLGMTRQQTFWHILLPQAVRTILPPSTNDFIALFKDTSIVSVITVTELTKAYNTAATTTYRFLELGLVTALLYLIMSYPLSLWSRKLERQRHETVH